MTSSDSVQAAAALANEQINGVEAELSQARAEAADRDEWAGKYSATFGQLTSALERAEAAEAELSEAKRELQEVYWIYQISMEAHDVAEAERERLRESLTEVVGAIKLTPSGFLSIIDDDPSRRAVRRAQAALAAPQEEKTT